MRILILVFGVAMVAYGCTRTGTISGRLVLINSNKPVTAATIQIAGTSHYAKSDANGLFAFREIPPGIYKLTGSEKTVALVTDDVITVERGKDFSTGDIRTAPVPREPGIYTHEFSTRAIQVLDNGFPYANRENGQHWRNANDFKRGFTRIHSQSRGLFLSVPEGVDSVTIARVEESTLPFDRFFNFTCPCPVLGYAESTISKIIPEAIAGDLFFIPWEGGIGRYFVWVRYKGLPYVNTVYLIEIPDPNAESARRDAEKVPKLQDTMRTNPRWTEAWRQLGLAISLGDFESLRAVAMSDIKCNNTPITMTDEKAGDKALKSCIEGSGLADLGSPQYPSTIDANGSFDVTTNVDEGVDCYDYWKFRFTQAGEGFNLISMNRVKGCHQ